MVVFFKGGIRVGRQHLAVGINVDARTICLLEQFFHILQIMAGDKNPRFCAHADIHFGDFRVAVGRGMGLIQQGHGVDRCLSGFHNQGDHIVYRQIFRGGGQGFHDEIVDFIFLTSQDGGVVRIGGNPFKADDQQLAKGADILVCSGQYAHGFGLFGKSGRIGRPGSCFGQGVAEIAAVFLLIRSQKL